MLQRSEINWAVWVVLAGVILVSPEVTAAADPIVVPVDGEPTPFRKITFRGESIEIETLANQTKTFAWRDLRAVRFRVLETPPLRPTGAQLVFPTGESIKIKELDAADADRVAVSSAWFPILSVPTAAAAGVLLDPDADDAEVARLLGWLAKKRSSDAALFRNRDELAGSFIELKDGSTKWETNKKERTAPKAALAAIAFDPSLTENKAPAGAFAVVRAFDGSAVRAAKLNSTAAELVETTLVSGATAAMKRDHVAEIEIRNGRIKYASDLPFDKVETQPFLDAAAPPRRDRNALGEPLRIDGAPVAKGIGMRSRGQISFAAAGFKRFEAKVALDDAAGSQGSVRFTVKADDKTVFDSGEMKPGDPPKDVRIELTRVRALVLAVDYAKRGDVDDLADWGDARFVE